MDELSKEIVLKTSLVLILCLYMPKEAFEYLVQYLNLRHMRKSGATIPLEFEGKGLAFLSALNTYRRISISAFQLYSTFKVDNPDDDKKPTIPPMMRVIALSAILKN